MKKRAEKQKLHHLFGRIVTLPDRFEGRPFILGRSVELAKVLGMLHEDKTDDEIRRRCHITKDDIDICRAWQVCFEPERLVGRFTRLADPQNFFMLDDNSSERMLYDVARLFGRSSHVRAEALTGASNDDYASIWTHLLRHDYKAFLTADSNFHHLAHEHRHDMISKYGGMAACPEPVPLVIFYDNQNPPETVVRSLENNQDAIRYLAGEKDTTCARLTVGDIVKIETDRPYIPRRGSALRA